MQFVWLVAALGGVVYYANGAYVFITGLGVL